MKRLCWQRLTWKQMWRGNCSYTSFTLAFLSVLIFCINLPFMLPQLPIQQHVTCAWVRVMLNCVKAKNCRLRCPVLMTHSPTLAQLTVIQRQEHSSIPTCLRLITQALQEDASTAQVSISPASPSSFSLTLVSYRVLNSWKSLEFCPAIFQPGEILQYRDTFWKNCLFFTSYKKWLTSEFFSLVKTYSISLVCLQRTMKAHEKNGSFLRFLRSLLITYLITLSLEKEIIVLGKKVWEKSKKWIYEVAGGKALATDHRVEGSGRS